MAHRGLGGKKQKTKTGMAHLHMVVEIILIRSKRKEQDIVNGDDGAQRVGVVRRTCQKVSLYGTKHLAKKEKNL